MSILGYDLLGDEIKPKNSGIVSDRFIVPPFTILDTKSGLWQERKRAWSGLGIQSELGRDSGVINMKSSADDNIKGEASEPYVSIFDPVLCETHYQWFCPSGGQILDPFAGGSVRGIVAGYLGFDYHGIELRANQVSANKSQSETIKTKKKPVWECGDSTEKLASAPQSDFIFSCPPYGNLEVYSDDPSDISNMDRHAFDAAYKRIIFKSCNKLRENSFACFVVGDYRDKNGNYCNFVSKTIEAFELAGLSLYNESILATSIASASMRVSKQFDVSRKMAKTHQNVLVFVKGDGRKASEKINKSNLVSQ